MDINAGTIRGWYDCKNEAWAGIMNKGQGPQEVTGGTVDMPQEGRTRPSKAAVVGGVYYDAEEPATGIFDELETFNKDILPARINDCVADGDLDTLAERIKSEETFMTNLGKSRLIVYKGECDNKDEIEATEQVIDSYQFHIECDISFDGVKEEITRQLVTALGGGS